MKKQLLIGHFLTLIVGGLIYISFRVDSLVMFRWFCSFSLKNLIDSLREMTLVYKSFLPDWLLYSLPDGLWVFSYVSLILLLWDNELSGLNIFWIFLMPILAIASELGQLLNLIPGTFDIIDLIFYILGTIMPLIIYNKQSSTFNTKTL